MDIMRLLTRKLKSQSLEAEEEQEVEEQDEEEEEQEEKEEETGAEGRRTFPEQRRNNDTTQATEFDSGTASDEDVAEFEEAPPPCLHAIVEAELHCQVVETQQMDRTTIDSGGCFSSQPTNATSKSSSVIISPQHVVSSVMMMTMPTASTKDSGISSSSSSRQSGPAAALSLASGRLSAVSSDFEWCSLDFEPASSSSCSSEMDQHSSEEELVSIYHHRHHEQKRKHSQMSSPNDNQCTSGEDEEEEELNKEDVEERFHRDCDHHRPLSSSNCLHGNHRCLHGNHRCLQGNVGIPISAASDFASPRKRHRQTTTTSVNSTAIQQQQQQQQQRPSLDLYKMQKTSITRKYNNGGCSNIASTNCRPRVVKIRTITGSSRPAKSSAYNPSVFSFRSISWASSRLKEEPFRAF